MNNSGVLKFIGLGDLSGKGFRTHFSFWAMVAMTFFLFGDQNLTSSNLPRIGADFGMGEEEYLLKLGSYVSVCFFIIGGAMSIVGGMLTDSWNRKGLLVGTVVVGELACFLTAFAPNYTWFLILRTLTGIGLGGIFPIVFSLVGDYFKQENRNAASGWLGLAMGLGILVGQVLGASLAHAEVFGMAGWRASFVIMAFPAFPLALLYAFIGVVPKRGGSESIQNADAVEEKHTVTLGDLKRVFSVPTNVLAIFQGIPGCVPWGLLFTYMVQFYEQGKGVHVDQATAIVAAFGVSTIFGVFIGGFIGKTLYLKKKTLLPIFCAVSILLGCIPGLYLVNYKRTGESVKGTEYTKSGLSPNKAHYFRVSAVRDKESEFSPVLAVEPNTTAGAPALFSAQSGDGEVKLNWAAVPGAEKYVLYFSKSEKESKDTTDQIAGATTELVQKNLKNGISYYYRVCAQMKDGSCNLSARITVTPAPVTPGVPQNVKIDWDGTTAKLNWTSDTSEHRVYENTTNPAEILIVLIMAVIGGLIAPIAGPNIRAIIINTNMPANRGSVLGVFNLADDLGKGLGPFFVGMLITTLPRTIAYNVAILFWVPCALLWLGMIKTMVRDENKVQEALKSGTR
ncbi:MAG: MFS transporter [Leptospirales bacterium]|nr:MFS transporter [Leptospirales bacterium]